jgi:DNA invertase Pin-like site-specific DNA recombinase
MISVRWGETAKTGCFRPKKYTTNGVGMSHCAETLRARFSAHAGRLHARVHQALAFIKPGDCLVVWKLDRLGRSLPHLLTTVTDLKKRGVAFRSLTEQMDTTTPQGEFLFHIFGSLAQFERSLIQERVQAGLAAARRRGRHGGRPAAIDAEKLAAVTAALDDGATKAAVCRTFGIKRSTLIDSLARIGWSAGIKVEEA